MTQSTLRRELGVFGATMLGLGSIIGTGIFVSTSIAAAAAGPAVLVAIALAAITATCNGLSSAQLAASHPVSGGTYEYGYRYLSPLLGFSAGWLFLLAKSASAATAALGFSSYLWTLLGGTTNYIIPTGLIAVAGITILVLSGLRRSNTFNTIIVSITLAALGFFVIIGLRPALTNIQTNLIPFAPFGIRGLLEASALMFVAYTGYGRIATMGEEVHNPRQVIPRAMITTLWLTAILYLVVTFVGVAGAGQSFINAATNNQAPLEVAAAGFGIPGAATILAIGAITAMLGVLLNLILGLSRVLLAMGRRHDMPPIVARLNQSATTPVIAVIVMGVTIAGLVLIGNVRTTWSFSAATVLLYYSLTNLAALRIEPENRLYPAWVSVLGLVLCLSLAVWVNPVIIAITTGLIAIGLIWKWTMNRTFGAA